MADLDVTLQYFDGCPNWQATETDLQGLVDEGLIVSVTRERIPDDEEAIAVGFPGSPTLLVDGVDLFPAGEPAGGLACRIYRSEFGFSGSPTGDEIRKALAALGNHGAM
jgi:hypothetical protein